MSTPSNVGSIAWRDLTVVNAESVRDFYKSVVGWEASPVDMGGYSDFNMLPPGTKEGVAGICHARGENADLPAQWLIYISVADLDASIVRCRELGGKVIAGPRSLGGGRFCVIEDPAGAVCRAVPNLTEEMELRVEVATVLNCAPEKAWAEVQTTRLLLEIIAPLLRFSPQPGETFPVRWREGVTLIGRAYALGFVPLGPHAICFERIDQERHEIQTREASGLIRRWDHLVRVETPPDGRTRYSDRIDIEAGYLTVLVWLYAQFFTAIGKGAGGKLPSDCETRSKYMKPNRANRRPPALALEIHPLTAARWADLETLFGPRGACGGCWCMSWRLKRADFVKGKGQPNRDAFKDLVDSGCEPGLLAYYDGKPVAWIAVAPREEYTVLERSRVLKPLDERPVWSVSCFFIAKSFRKKGVSVALLKAAAEFVRKKGGALIEGYPVEPKMKNMPDVFAWTGLPSAFLQAGFTEAARRSPTRPIMRLNVAGKGVQGRVK